jgi:hypothetical protein
VVVELVLDVPMMHEPRRVLVQGPLAVSSWITANG